MIFQRTGEIFCPELIFYRDDNRTRTGKGRNKVLQELKLWIVHVGNDCSCIFEHADNDHQIESALCRDDSVVVANNGNIRKISRSLAGNASPGKASFNSNNLRAAFTEKTRHGAATCPHFEDLLAGEAGCKRAQQVGSRGAQMIKGGPIGDGFAQLLGK